ncbi:MAG: formimidoylglutamate deiminase [Actinobacteria bacterium]|nr:formimidoylglutamate deiminase [Actinomycetota bacterium]
MRLWCEYAWLGGAEVAAGVAIEVEKERIVAVEARAARPAEDAVVLPGYTLPGLANAHSHAFQRAFRGKAETGKGTFWTWRERMYEAASRLDPDSYFALARATFAEMALAGVTGVGEFHYLHHDFGGTPYEDPNAIGGALAAAAREAGIRITLIDACYLHGGIGEGLSETQRRFSDGTVERWVERVDALRPGPGVRIGAAIHSVRAVEPAEAVVVAEWAAAREAPLHAHVSEQPAENEACREAYGSSPTLVLAEAGVLGDRFTAVHATHLSEGDRELLGEAGATVCLCPTTERNLADGIGPASLLRQAGADLAVGSDSQAVIDIFEECRAIELDERLARLERGNQDAASLLRAGTATGHRAIGWPEAGAIEPGRLADLVNLDAGGVRLAGITPDSALGSIVFAATAADVTNVVVGGEFVVKDGKHLRIDVEDELRHSIAGLAGAG